MPPKKPTQISRTGAERAIYIDFEGTRDDPPSFLGAAWADGEDRYFIQFVIERTLWPAAEAKAGMPDRIIEPATWETLTQLRTLAETENRHLIAYTEHERQALQEHVDGEAGGWFGSNVVNALPIAKAWKRRAFPEVVFERDPKRPMKGKHHLDRYFKLIGYNVPKAFGPNNSAKRIKATREMLTRKNGDYAALTPTVKAKWTKALQHNWYDCDGLRELMLRCAT